MIFKKYNHFINYERINEDVQKAKKFLKDTYLFNKSVKDIAKIDQTGLYILNPDSEQPIKHSDISDNLKEEARKKFRETKVSEDEIRHIERNPDYLKIKEIIHIDRKEKLKTILNNV